MKPLPQRAELVSNPEDEDESIFSILQEEQPVFKPLIPS